jgi:hypothetical protein
MHAQPFAAEDAAAAFAGGALEALFPDPFPMPHLSLARRLGPLAPDLAETDSPFTKLLAQALHALDSPLPPRLIDTGRRRVQRRPRDANSQDESGPHDSFHGVFVPPPLLDERWSSSVGPSELEVWELEVWELEVWKFGSWKFGN